jgi:hypothetical protein
MRSSRISPESSDCAGYNDAIRSLDQQMTVNVVIENGILAGSDYDADAQRIATVYVDGERYHVVAPAKLRGEALKFTDHFSVREPSKDALDFGAEFAVTDGRKAVIVKAVAEELRRQKRNSGPVGLTPDGLYYEAQICIRGHVQSYAGTPYTPGDHCSKCGSACIDECSTCQEPIRGLAVNTKWTGFDPPSYCHGCGQAYPWMQERLQTARELLYHDDKLTLDEREKLWGLLQYVMSNPESDLVPAKKKLFQIGLAKALPATRDLLLDFMAKLGAEMLKP